MTETTTFQVTELSTHKDTYADEYEEILYGDDYVKHDFSTIDKARACEAQLNAKGIKTNLAQVTRVVVPSYSAKKG